MRSVLKRLGLAFTAVLATTAFSAAPAHAVDCDPDLTDPTGMLWELDYDGEITDAENPAVGGDGDAYDDVGEVSIDADGDASFDDYDNPDNTACTTEDGGREYVYPTGTVEGIEVSPKIYVPGSGALGFARILISLRNPGASDATVDMQIDGNYGADSSTLISGTSDGDTTAEVGDRWWAIQEGLDHGDAEVASVIDGPEADDAFDAFLGEAPGSGNDDFDVQYDGVTIPAGGTVTYMRIEHVVDNDDDSHVRWAEQYGDGTDEFYAGMSEDEMSTLRNWSADSDRDGIRDYDDNCPRVANADQADMDGDGIGDACDDDIDGDGLTNAQEQRLGTDPRSPDTDGDGRPDGVDQCPTLAGGNENGCPSFTTQSPPVVQLQRLVPQRVTAKVTAKRTRRGVRVVTAGRIVLPAGVSPQEGCDGNVSVQVKTGGNTVSTRQANVRPNCRYRSAVLFTMLDRLVRPKMTSVARFNGTQRLRPRRAARQSFTNPAYRSDRR